MYFWLTLCARISTFSHRIGPPVIFSSKNSAGCGYWAKFSTSTTTHQISHDKSWFLTPVSSFLGYVARTISKRIILFFGSSRLRIFPWLFRLNMIPWRDYRGKNSNDTSWEPPNNFQYSKLPYNLRSNSQWDLRSKWYGGGFKQTEGYLVASHSIFGSRRQWLWSYPWCYWLYDLLL